MKKIKYAAAFGMVAIGAFLMNYELLVTIQMDTTKVTGGALISGGIFWALLTRFDRKNHE